MRNAILFLILLIPVAAFPMQESFVIGNGEGDAQLIFPRQVEEGPDGNIYIYDQQSAVIKVFSPDGHFLRKMCGKGEGPGEIKRTDDVAFNFTFDKKRLYFTEYFGGHRWITFMELSGKFHSVLKLDVGTEFAVLRSVPLKDGGFLAQISLRFTPEKKKEYFLYWCPTALVKINPDGRIGTEVLRTEHVERISFHEDGADLPVPFIPVFIWTLLPDGRLVFSEGSSTVLKVYDLEGKRAGEIKTPLPEPKPVTAEDLEKWKKNLSDNFRDKSWYNRFGKVIEKYTKSIYEKKPNMYGVSVTPGSRLLIAGDSVDSSNRVYWLTDLEGNLVKKIAIKGSGLKISNHFVFAYIYDEDENVQVFCLNRKGNEAEDLARLEEAIRKI
jgi:hypothetical protein